MAKNLNARIALKHDSLENWKKATGFIPQKGEPFLVDDYEFPLVLGDGETPASELCLTPFLEFITTDEIDDICGETIEVATSEVKF